MMMMMVTTKMEVMMKDGRDNDVDNNGSVDYNYANDTIVMKIPLMKGVIIHCKCFE